MQKLRDIKPIVEIPDYSFWIYFAFIVVITLLAAILVYQIVKLLSTKKVNRRKEILQMLRNLDCNDSKKCAYLLTKYGKYLVTDESRARLYEDLVKKLTHYKYKKNVSTFPEDLKKEIRLFLRVHDE
ncbi:MULTISPECIES: hypothetical protein [unclassified Nitratiruptor]|uniref:hypothetical protein n=1 Tax=unclassified Nitratiruptor TaxID=2624044 RepID=UPI001914F910|nr:MULTISPECIES: hypothetical protein [unclassified Nitratiruptor]BCD59740.1 hypothetical protein NitYY0810_C0496 [Nitratiruptor sp. YY08-10]BCD63664.1 hypothetical protein NitYY0814_C0496 [Nitratiruptor sp. YY08-14]